ncbi:helix-turn-helix transcriptional regulator [Microbacterium limosum]|uniref:Helix-turn-helix transcriptional regulator n=1 Tax=Microbacterium limosum TaxID=3079935 RepID=A0AAU0MJ07_9MICO|nr:helix-turn-helix transcriptional regulator [Microbacterium sp. Y20]WOQ70075.1 helix-turn-helix transcriptional regulator [Microbacterium sp. Y20]
MSIGEAPLGPVVRGTTRGLLPGPDYEHFCESIADVYVGVRPERPAGGAFAADFALYALDDLAVGIISTPGVSAHRDRGSLARVADDGLFVNYSPRSWALRQHRREHRVAGGSAVVLDNARPFSVVVDPRRRLDLLSLRVPRGMLAPKTVSLLPDLDDRLAASRSGALLGAQMGLLSRALRSGVTAAARSMASAAVELLDAIAADDPDAPPPARVDSYRAYARSRLGDPALDVGAVARAFARTTRTIQSAFAGEGQTFSAWLRDERLDRARELLSAPSHAARSVAWVARTSGFRDVGTFHRAYRARFGSTPGADR